MTAAVKHKSRLLPERYNFRMWLTKFYITIVSLALAEVASVKSICDSNVVIGQSATLTCKLTGNIENGINWYKSGTVNPIISCKKNTGVCASGLYSANNITSDIQNFTINKVTEDDLTRTWTCVDGFSPSDPTASSCKLSLKTAETTVNCLKENVNVGKPFTLTCNIKGTVVHGINWFRDKKNVIACKKTGECSTSKADLYKTENITGTTHQLTILDVTEEDLKKTWTCVDATSCTDNTTSQCNLNILIDEATGASVGSSIIVAVLIVIIDVVLYLVCKDYLSELKKIYIIYCVVDIVIVGVTVGVASYYIYLTTSNIGIIAGLCVGFLVVSTVIKLIVVKTNIFSKCLSSGSSDIRENRPV